MTRTPTPTRGRLRDAAHTAAGWATLPWIDELLYGLRWLALPAALLLVVGSTATAHWI